MCRNIRTLHNFTPPATAEEMRAAAIQYVRKVSGYTRVPKVNEEAFETAVDHILGATEALLETLVATGEPKDREREADKARERWRAREERLRK